jgi:hypothetical protein
LFWTLLAAYFGVRYFALGTFVGGYDDSLLFIANFSAFAQGWLHALKMTIEPINHALLGSHSWLTKVWQVGIVSTLILGAISFIRQPRLRLTFVFLSAWLVLSLLPVYKIFAISDDLQGSRLAYLATAPLCALIAVALIGGQVKSRLYNRLRHVILIALSTAAFCILWINNQAWHDAGKESNAIRFSLGALYSGIYGGIHGDPNVLLLGLPDQINGAYTCRNALWGMTKVPQMDRDIVNCQMVNEFEPIFPFGYLKESIWQERKQIFAFYWSSKAKFFLPLKIEDDLKQPQIAEGIEAGDGTALTRSEDGSLRILSTGRQRPSIVLHLDSPCWNADVLSLNLDVSGTTSDGAELLYANNITPGFILRKRTHAELRPGSQTILLPLRNLPEWGFGTTDGRLKLMLPRASQALIKSMKFIDPHLVMPSLSFANSGYLGTKGYLHLGRDAGSKLSVDSSKVTGAASSRIEITRANLLFEEQNCRHPSNIAGQFIDCPLKGDITLNRSGKSFNAPGIYELRAWALDAQGQPVGVSSDHIVISVDP